jgi:hypothetical protein
LHARLRQLQSQIHAYWDPEGAVPMTRRAIAKLEEALGPDHPEVLDRKQDLAFGRLGMFDLEMAQSLYDELLEARQRVDGRDHVETLRTRSDMGWLAKRRGDFAGAVVALEACLADQRRVLGSVHPDTFSTLVRLAGAVIDAGRQAEGRSMLLAELDRMRSELGAHHPAVLAAHFNVAAASGLLGEAEIGGHHLRIALEGGFNYAFQQPDGRVLFDLYSSDQEIYAATLADPDLAPLRETETFQAMLGPEGYLRDFHAALNAEPAQALELLQTAVRKGYSDAERLATHPGLYLLRGDARFEALVEELRRRSAG